MARDIDIGTVPIGTEVVRRTRLTTAIAGAGTGESVNLIKIKEAVKILSIHGKFTDVTDVSAVTAAYLDVYDDDSKTITGVAGTDLSGVAEGSVIGKNGIKTALLALWDAADGAVIDGVEGTDWLAPFVVVAQNGIATYIRFNFTSDEGGYEFTIDWEIEWQPLFLGGNVIPQ